MSSIVVDNEKDRPIASPRDDISEAEKVTSVAPSEVYITPPDGGKGWVVVAASFMVDVVPKKKKKKKEEKINLTFN